MGEEPSSAEPDTGEPDAIKVARPVREGAVGNLRKPVAPVVRRRESQQGAGRLLHRFEAALRTGGWRTVGKACENVGTGRRLKVLVLRDLSPRRPGAA